MSLWTLYWMSVLPNVGPLFVCTGIIIIVLCLLVWSFLYLDEPLSFQKEEREKQKIKLAPIFKKSFFVGWILLLLGCVIPSEKQMYIIVGGYTTTNIEGINKLPVNVVSALNSYLEKLNKDVNNTKE